MPSPADDGPTFQANVIPDEPAKYDEFGPDGPHSRIANALAALITGKPVKGRCIALTGPWGSGKSSVIAQLETKLGERAQAGSPPAKVFVFDAWIHQGDPLRRCFLESLIEFAGRSAKDSEAKIKAWTNTLDEITGRRELTRASAERPLNNLAVWIAVSLLVCFPLGGAFLGKYDASKYSFWSNNFAWVAMALYSIPVILSLFALRNGGLGKMASVVIRDLHQDTKP